jgi:hypothetical protein
MATPPSSASANTGPGQRWIELLVRRRRETAIGFFILAGLLAILPVWMIFALGTEYLVLIVLLSILAAVPALAGLWQISRAPGEKPGDWDHARLLALVFGGALGLSIVAIGLGLIYTWWSQYLFGVGLARWRAEWWRLALILGCELGGFLLMFVSLQLAQVDVRTNPLMRRLLYGYNAVLSGLLLLLILGLVNVLAYVQAGPFRKLGETADWTSSNIYSLSDSSKNLLSGLEKPVKVYVFKSGWPAIDGDIETLLNNCKVYTNKLEVEYLSADRNTQRMNELANKYREIERTGILLVYGTEPNEEHVFITLEDLGKLPMRLTGADDLHFDEFDGENALMGKLRFLIEGKTRPKIYFTQGDGEMDLSNGDLRDATGLGIGVLRNRLNQFNYEVRELKFGQGTAKVPDDAAVVVIARPEQFSPEGIKALRDYMSRPGLNNQKGKLIVCAGMVYDPRTGVMSKSGLEELLAEYQVEVSQTRILTARNPLTAYPLDVLVLPDLRNPKGFARELFSGGQPFFYRFPDARVARPLAQTNPGVSRPYQVDELLYAYGELGGRFWGVWEEADARPEHARAIADELSQLLATDPKRQKVKNRLPVAVTVSETPAGDSRRATPRMVVYGDAAWLRNLAMREGGQEENFDLFRSTIQWLRERSDIGRVAEPKTRKRFILERTDTFAMAGVPAFLISVAVIGLGAGIWVVRRR